MKQSELSNLQNERTALDTKISTLETELGINQSKPAAPSSLEQFQAERDAKPSPFEVKK
jgi:hypothetical protein